MRDCGGGVSEVGVCVGGLNGVCIWTFAERAIDDDEDVRR